MVYEHSSGKAQQSRPHDTCLLRQPSAEFCLLVFSPQSSSPSPSQTTKHTRLAFRRSPTYYPSQLRFPYSCGRSDYFRSPGPRNTFPVIWKTCRIVTCFYSDWLNTQFIIYTRVHFVYHRLSSCPLDRNLGSPSKINEGATTLGVGEIFEIENLEFPVLLDKSVGDGGIIVDRGPKDGGEHGCDLRRS